MTLDFTGITSGFEGKDIPKDVKKFIEDAKSNEILKENNVGVYDRNEVEGLAKGLNTFKNISLFLIIAFLLVGGSFAYLVWDGKFQSNINQNLSCPAVNISCPDIPSQPACPTPAPIYINTTCPPTVVYVGGNNS